MHIFTCTSELKGSFRNIHTLTILSDHVASQAKYLKDWYLVQDLKGWAKNIWRTTSHYEAWSV